MSWLLSRIEGTDIRHVSRKSRRISSQRKSQSKIRGWQVWRIERYLVRKESVFRSVVPLVIWE